MLGPVHPSTLISVNNLGPVLESQGKYDEAEVMHRRDSERSEKMLGPEHPDTLISIILEPGQVRRGGSNAPTSFKREGERARARIFGHALALEGLLHEQERHNDAS